MIVVTMAAAAAIFQYRMTAVFASERSVAEIRAQAVDRHLHSVRRDAMALTRALKAGFGGDQRTPAHLPTTAAGSPMGASAAYSTDAREELAAVSRLDPAFRFYTQESGPLFCVSYRSAHGFGYTVARRTGSTMANPFAQQDNAPAPSQLRWRLTSELGKDTGGLVWLATTVQRDARTRGILSVGADPRAVQPLLSQGEAIGRTMLVDRRGGVGRDPEIAWFEEVVVDQLWVLHHLNRSELYWATAKDASLAWALLLAAASTSLLAVRLNARLTKVTHLMDHDPLTGMLNRRGLRAAIDEWLEYAREEGWYTAVVALDIDHFKAINDELGHRVGDKALGGIARRLRSGIKEHDMLCRWGGEEFLLLLTDEHPSSFFKTADRLRRSTAQRPVSDVPVTITLSAGMTVWTPSESLDTAVARADALMYQAKERGRDRLVTD